MSRITLIRPPVLVSQGQLSLTVIPPIGMAYLAASLRKDGHIVQVVDAVGESISQYTPFNDLSALLGMDSESLIERIDSQTDVIGLSLMFSHEWPAVRLLLEKIRKRFPNRPLIVGGEHASALAEFVLGDSPAVDVCIVGEGEETTRELLTALTQDRLLSEVCGIVYRQDGKPFKTPPRARIHNIDDLPTPAWNLFPLKNYLDHGICSGANRGRSLPIIATRGCPYHCQFCSNADMWTRQWICRDPVKVLEEMKEAVRNYQIENFEFCDLTAIVRKDWTIKFATLLIESGLNIHWQFPSGTRSEAIDAEVCDLLYRSGCQNLAYAPESGSPELLKRIHKEIHLDKMKESIRAAIRRGINVRVHFVIGFPEETHREVWQTFRFIAESAFRGVHDMTHFIFVPYPGSELFKDLRKSGKIPELSDRYFLNLLAMTDLKQTVSYTDHISTRALSFYRVAALFLFYSLMFLCRPWRIFIILKNVFKDKQESRMESALQNLIFPHRSAQSTLRAKVAQKAPGGSGEAS